MPTKNVYQQIVKDIEFDLQRGLYTKNNNKLPSLRDMCQKYSCCQSTVIKAYEVLKNKKIVYSVPQSGYYIVGNIIKQTAIDTTVIDFSVGNPITGEVYIPDLKHCLDRAADFAKYYSLEDSIKGISPLKNILPDYFTKFQVFTSPDNIFINLGIQQALAILSNVSFPNGKNTILIEQPSYRFFLIFLKITHAHVIGIERNEYGVDLNKLEHLFKTQDIKFFYTIPQEHNPLGTTYSVAQKRAIAALAKKYDVYIVEDDYFSDLLPRKKVNDPIYAYGDNDHHIYLKSFSKLLPWIRLGLIVLPNQLIPLFRKHKLESYLNSYFTASLISQATLEIYMRSNILEKHANSVQKDISEKIPSLQAQLKQLSQYDIKYTSSKNGFYSHLKLPVYIKKERFIEQLREKQVLIHNARSNYLDNFSDQNSVRISIANVNNIKIKKGFEIISSILETYKK